MNEYLEYLRNPLIAGVVGGVFIVILGYIDKYVNERDFDKYYFMKVFMCVFALVAGLVYFVSTPSKKIMSGGAVEPEITGGNPIITTVVKKLNSMDIDTNAPDF